MLACNTGIKNEDAEISIEEGTAIIDTSKNESSNVLRETETENFSNLMLDTVERDYWVGFFEPHFEISMVDKTVYGDEALGWGRQNKISISIDTIIGDSVFGHSVVAGNHRPFSGNYEVEDDVQRFYVQEPGDDKYDGTFEFRIFRDELMGEWEAFKEIDIPKRQYKLSLKTFKYDPDRMLYQQGRYGDWNKFVEHKDYEVFDEGTPEEEVYEWVQKEFASSTNKIYEINASNTLLSKADVENLTNSDLVVIRNTIYARHGYSFKYRPLRVFFDEQEWYIPVRADIKQTFTEIEKHNIQLLLKYEKNAKEYYDYFGRG